MDNTELFINWNKALFSYFFPDDLDEEEEVSLYINRDIIAEIGKANKLGGYDDFIQLVLLPLEERRNLILKLGQLYVSQNYSLTKEQRNILKSRNLFNFATLFLDDVLCNNLECPFLIYIIYAVLMGSECNRKNEILKKEGKKPIGIGNFITDQLKTSFPQSSNRESLEELFYELAYLHPQFRAEKLTQQAYIGLIKYQLGLSKPQEKSLEKAMYYADLSEDLPYKYWIDRITDFLDQPMKNLLNRSLNDAILRRRISDLRNNFDSSIYERRHNDENIISNGHFVLAVYEDEYSADADRLVLLTDVNNKTISTDHLKITKGTFDRLGEYAEYNVNHVLIGESDKAEMKSYSIRSGGDNVSSISLGNIVTFSRCSSNYLIQTKYPQKGKETYILVKDNHEEEWNKWLTSHGSPSHTLQTNENRVLQIFGRGWQLYVSNEIECTRNELSPRSEFTITMDGGIRRIGMNNVFLITALPYFEFSEPIIMDNLSVFINVDGKCQEDNAYNLKIIDNNKLVIDFISIEPRDNSLEIGITLEYKRGKGKPASFHEDFKVIGQDVNYKDEDLFKIDMWGNLTSSNESAYLEGFKLFKGNSEKGIPNQTGFYQNRVTSLDIHYPRFYLINLITAECSMRKGFSITESRLKKCIRYAATRFDINIASNPSFYTDIKYLLINCGYINADFEQGKYQPIPPTIIKLLSDLILKGTFLCWLDHILKNS